MSLLPTLLQRCRPWCRSGGIAIGLLLAASAAADGACPEPRNLLRDPRFRTLGAPAASPVWTITQHSSDTAFVARAEKGVLEIEKTGDEPWFILSQRVKRRDLAGRTVRFSAVVKFDVSEPESAHSFDYEAGLYLAVQNAHRQRVVHMAAEHEPNFGQTDWVVLDYEVTLPKNAAALDVGFLHRAGGVISATRPELVFVGDGACEG